MANINHTTTINGIDDFTAPNGDTISWNGSTYIDFAGMWSSSTDVVTSNTTLAGSNWEIEAMRYHSSAEFTNISDANGQGGRRIEYLKLGMNSDIDLISTRIKILLTHEGGDLHDVTLGSEFTALVELGAASNVLTTQGGFVETIRTRGDDTVTIGAGGARLLASYEGTDVLTVHGRLSSAELNTGTKTVTVSDSGDISTLRMWQADATVTMQGDGRIQYIKVDESTLNLTTGTQFQESMNTWNTTNTIVNNGGMGAVEINADMQLSQTIVSNDWIGSLYVRDNQDTDLTLNDNAGFLRLGERGDTVTQTAGWTDLIGTRAGWDDVTINGQGVETLFLGDGFDTATINGYVGTLGAGNGNDTVTANGGGTTLRMDDGDDLLIVGAGGVRMAMGDAGNDTIRGGDGGIGWMRGGDGNDLLELGAGGAWHVEAGADNDRVIMADLPDQFTVTAYGGSGTDWMDFSAVTAQVTFSLDMFDWQNYGAPGAAQDQAGNGWLLAFGFENLAGSNEGDALTGDEGDNVIEGRIGLDTIYGLDGNDTLHGHKGHDLVNGNAGFDEIYGQIGNDTLYGGKGYDRLYGGDMADHLAGNAGNDSLWGGNGADTLDGGIHDDYLWGGNGNDVFAFYASAGDDLVDDFTQGEDVMQISDHTGGFSTLDFATVGGDLTITHDGGTITLADGAGTTLTSADFDFV